MRFGVIVIFAGGEVFKTPLWGIGLDAMCTLEIVKEEVDCLSAYFLLFATHALYNMCTLHAIMCIVHSAICIGPAR